MTECSTFTRCSMLLLVSADRVEKIEKSAHSSLWKLTLRRNSRVELACAVARIIQGNSCYSGHVFERCVPRYWFPVFDEGRNAEQEADPHPTSVAQNDGPPRGGVQRAVDGKKPTG